MASLQNMAGNSPARSGQPLERVVLMSIVGPIIVSGDASHIYRLQFAQDPADVDQAGDEPESPALGLARQQLREYFSGTRRCFELPLHLSGTPFQIKAWRLMEAIAYGDCLSYGRIAEQLGNVHLARAVGQAAHRNPLPIIIPCHRVVGSAGRLGGFAPGVRLKKILLEHEKRRTICSTQIENPVLPDA